MFNQGDLGYIPSRSGSRLREFLRPGLSRFVAWIGKATPTARGDITSMSVLVGLLSRGAQPSEVGGGFKVKRDLAPDRPPQRKK